MRQSALFLVLILAAALAHAQDLPKRKSGLWAIKWTTMRGTEGKSRDRDFQMCVDQATDNPLIRLNLATRKETCKVSKVRRDGDQVTVDAVCTLSKTTATTHAVITGKFDSAYKIESKSTYDPPLHGETEGSVSHQASWLGPCKPDQRPGDVILASGKKFNINERADGATAGKAGAATSAPPGTRSSSKSNKPASSAPTQ